MTWRKIRRRLAIFGGLMLVAFCVVVWIEGNSLIASANRAVGAPPDDLKVITSSIASESGSSLATWYIPAANSQATIILLHPMKANRLSMWGRAKLFHQSGYAVVMIDFQAHGESPGDYITVGYLERYDVRAAVNYARQTSPKHRIGIVGWSLGAAATLLAAPLDVDAVVLEAVYPTISEAVHNRIAMRLGPLSYVLSPALLGGLQLRCGISPSDLRPIDHIAEIGCPVLVAAGDLDRHTTMGETQRLFDAAIQPKKLVVFEGAAHIDLLAYDRKQYESEVLAFFATYLASPSTDHSLSTHAEQDTRRVDNPAHR